MIYFIVAYLLSITDASLLWWGGFVFMLFLDLCWQISRTAR